ncbi:hypothetical protein RB195_012474 [Necator americanus]|uniref:tRNA pseudouridine synthase n=1 Tax=Necator americanus TaxID=51031 RepID=A0ABR1D8F9_NECAM
MGFGSAVTIAPVRRYLLRISYDGSRFPEMATGGTGFGVVDMLYQTICDSLFGTKRIANPLRESLKLSPSSRKYTYRLAVVRDWERWDSVQEHPTTACFSEKDYAWRLPPGFSPEKALDACSLFIGEQVMGSFFKHTAREKRKELHQPSAVKKILLCQLSKGAPYSVENSIYDYYNVTIVARSFVREQIRRMMSCIVFRGYDRLPMETIRWLLKNPISTNFYDIRIPIAPPQGLFLVDVVYPPEMFTNPFPYYRHYWDYPAENCLIEDS